MRGTRIALRTGMVLDLPEVGDCEIDLAVLWQSLINGQFFVAASTHNEGRIFATLTSTRETAQSPSPQAVRVLERVLAGESQKEVAQEFGVTVATVAGHCSDALGLLTYERRSSRVPIFVVMAAMAGKGLPLPRARLEERSASTIVVSIEMPGLRFATLLSPVEWTVARFALEGQTHAQIARARGTSRRTVANQLASVFVKLRTSGRASLRAMAVAACARTSSAV